MKTQPKHTPGPWSFHPDNELEIVANFTTGESVDFYSLVATVGDARGLEAGTPEANARLIAAAPDLLEALIEALPWVEAQLDDPVNKPGTVRAVARRIRAAIAKAEGGTP